MNNKIDPSQIPYVNLEDVSDKIISGSLDNVPIHIGLVFAKEYKRHCIDKRAMETVIRDLQTVVDEKLEAVEHLNKELGRLSAKNDWLTESFNEQTAELEGVLRALNKKPFTKNLVLDLAIAIAELQTRGK